MTLSPDVIDWLLERIHAGDSQAECARLLGVDPGNLSRMVAACSQADLQRFAQAREASAEGWYDKGAVWLLYAMDKNNNIDATAARAYEQHCARMAAIRNPKYKDRSEVAVTGADGGSIKVATIAATVTAEQAAQAYKDIIGG